MLQFVRRKISQAATLHHSCAPSLPLIGDSLKMARSPYSVTVKPRDLSFTLEPGVGDWFTLLECCVRLDYVTTPITLEPGDVVVDIGGNFGAFSVLAGNMVGPGGQVFCYEPFPPAFERIQNHIAAANGLDNVVVTNAGVSGQAGRFHLNLSGKSAYNSLYSEIDGREMGQGRSVEVEIISAQSIFDSMPDTIDLMKIDCEGAEYDIFDSLDDATLRRVRQYAIEMHRLPDRDMTEIRHRLEGLGYQTARVNPFLAWRAPDGT